MGAKGSDPSAKLEECIFKIIDPEGAISTGFFVSADGNALSCYHVVRPRRDQPPYKILDIEYQNQTLQVEFITGDPDKDIAILKLKQRNVPIKKPARLGLPWHINDPVVVLGYHRQYRTEDLDRIYGHIEEYNPIQDVKFEEEIGGRKIIVWQKGCLIIVFDQYPWEEGMSGAPVFNRSTQKVIAIATGKRDPHVYYPSRGYAIFLDDVYKCWPDLERYCPRVKFDPWEQEPWPKPFEFVLHGHTVPAHWVGRETELNDLTQLVREGKYPVISIVAFGGTGKSSLVRKLLEKFLDGAQGWLPKPNTPFEGGLWFSFYAEPSADRFLDEACVYLLGDAYDRTLYSKSFDKAALLARKLAKRRLLVVLDGFEKMLEEDRESPYFGACKESALSKFLGNICTQTQSQLIIASRYPLVELADLAEHYQYKLGDLSPEDALALMQALGVKGDSRRILEVCAHYGYHVLTLQVLARFLARNYDGDIEAIKYLPEVPATDPQGAKLKSILDSWWASLSETERFFLTRASAFRWLPISEDAFGVLTPGDPNDPEFRAMVARLVDSQLLNKEKQEGKTIYTLHPLIKDDFYKRMSEKNRQNVHLELINHAKELIRYPQPQTISDLKPLLETYFHYLQTMLFQKAYRIYRATLNYPLLWFGQYELALSLLEPLIAAFEQSPPVWKASPHHQSWILGDSAVLLSRVGHTQEAIRRLKRKIQLDRDREQKKHESIGWLNLGLIYIEAGSFRQALEAFQLVYFREMDSLHSLIGACYTELGQLEIAQRELDRGLQLSKEQFKERNECAAWRQYGDFCLRKREIYAAQACYEKSIAIARRKRFFDFEGHALRGLGDYYHLIGNIGSAYQHYNQALEIATIASYYHLEAKIRVSLARLALVDGDYEDIEGEAAKALKIAEECGYKVQATEAHLLLARVAQTEGNRDKLHKHLDAARDLINQTEHHWTKQELIELNQEA